HRGGHKFESCTAHVADRSRRPERFAAPACALLHPGVSSRATVSCPIPYALRASACFGMRRPIKSHLATKSPCSKTSRARRPRAERLAGDPADPCEPRLSAVDLLEPPPNSLCFTHAALSVLPRSMQFVPPPLFPSSPSFCRSRGMPESPVTGTSAHSIA